MSDLRHKDANWTVPCNSEGKISFEGAQLAVLLDLRDELKRLNAVFACYNFRRIPSKLEAIRKNTAKRRKKVTK